MRGATWLLCAGLTAVSAACSAGRGGSSPDARVAAAPGPAAGQATAPVEAAPAPAWLAVARQSRLPDAAERLAAAERRLANLSATRRARVTPVLEGMASVSPDVPGLVQAARLAAEAKVGDLEWAGSGTHPAVLALHEAGLAVLAGLVAGLRTTDGLDEALRTMPLPAVFNSGGRTGEAEDRELLEHERSLRP